MNNESTLDLINLMPFKKRVELYVFLAIMIPFMLFVAAIFALSFTISIFMIFVFS